MINQIHLKNYESHKDTTLIFHSGINVIIGIMDSGKTSILRALNWIVNNRPSGTTMVSDWNRDKKDKPTQETSAKVILGGNIQAVTRLRTNDVNGYEITSNGHSEVFNAVKAEVPDEISNVVNMSDVNIQKQHDPHFMLSWSAPDVARFLSKIINLEQIDNILSLANSYHLQFNKDIRNYESAIAKLEGDLKNYEWTDKAGKILRRANRINDQVFQLEQGIIDLETILDNIIVIEEELQKYKNLGEAERLRIIIEERIELIENKEYKIDQLEDIIDKIRSIKIIDQKRISEAEKIRDKIKIEWDKYKSTRTRYLNLKGDLFEINQHIEFIKEKKEIIKNLESQLPTICPVCKRRLK